uniref:non-specific serine/threonine protein kinase n=1 Tax=Salix viminalis TaxID=40686 RepID=A0A6N2NH95_SALVM
MENLPSFNIIIFIVLFSHVTQFIPWQTLAKDLPCRTTCGSIQVKTPFGSGHGCGSPRFHPYIACSPEGDQLLLTTHTGSYPVTSISYTTSTLIITPPQMSTCTSMQQSPGLGIDWASPFQLGQSTFLLLSCTPPTSSLTIKGSPVCDTSSHLCESIYTCPSVIGLGLPLFPPTNTCCVYSPANFNSKGELDLQKLKCMGYASVVSLQEYPTDPSRWQYGVELQSRGGALDDYYTDNKCNACEISGGLCGYAPPVNSFVCLCSDTINTTIDSQSNSLQNQAELTWNSVSLPSRKLWMEFLGGLVFFGAAW